LWQTILNGRIFTGEIWNRRKDGTEYAEDKRISTFVKSQGTISSFVSSGRNITDRLEAERLKEETEQMLRHDLKNPVSAIVGLGEILKDCESLDRCREMGVLIENTANEVLSIAELSGTLFAMEKHSFTFEPVPVDLLETARSLTDLYYSFLKIKNITLNIVQEGDNTRALYLRQSGIAFLSAMPRTGKKAARGLARIRRASLQKSIKERYTLNLRLQRARRCLWSCSENKSDKECFTSRLSFVYLPHVCPGFCSRFVY